MKKETTSYIYAIQHNKTHKIYVGKTGNVRKRYEQHIIELKAHKHRSKEMQRDFDEYGPDFSVYILEKVEDCKKRADAYSRTNERNAELKWMKKYNTIFDGYNIQDAVAKRMILTEEIKYPIKEGLPIIETEGSNNAKNQGI